jgi:hypothetical protein
MPQIDFIGGAYEAFSSNVAKQETVNLYPETTPDKKSVMALRGTPGTIEFCNIGAQPVRGFHVVEKSNALLYAVSGTKLYSITAAGVATERGTLNTTFGRVSMSDNGTQITITDGTNGYTYTIATTTFAQIADVDFPTADVNLFLDGYTIVNKANSGSFQISSSYDSTAYSALDIKTAEGDPDNLATIAKRNRQLFAIGTTSTEVFYNSGSGTPPFERVNGLIIDAGCLARWSVATVNKTLMWLTKEKEGAGYVMRLDGYTPVRVSTAALDYAISSYGDVSDAFAYSYHRDGHIFYVLTFPTVKETWCYDAVTNMWHKRETYGCDGRHLSNAHIFFNNKHYVGDYRNGKIYELSESAYTDDGDPIIAYRTSPYVYQDNNPINFASFEVGFETGVGNSDCEDPQASLQWSDDGGHTWSNEHWKSIGRIGEYANRVRWTRLGQAKGSHGRLWKVGISDPVKRVMINASVNGR